MKLSKIGKKSLKGEIIDKNILTEGEKDTLQDHLIDHLKRYSRVPTHESMGRLLNVSPSVIRAHLKNSRFDINTTPIGHYIEPILEKLTSNFLSEGCLKSLKLFVSMWVGLSAQAPDKKEVSTATFVFEAEKAYKGANKNEENYINNDGITISRGPGLSD